MGDGSFYVLRLQLRDCLSGRGLRSSGEKSQLWTSKCSALSEPGNVLSQSQDYLEGRSFTKPSKKLGQNPLSLILVRETTIFVHELTSL